MNKAGGQETTMLSLQSPSLLHNSSLHCTLQDLTDSIASTDRLVKSSTLVQGNHYFTRSSILLYLGSPIEEPELSARKQASHETFFSILLHVGS